MHKHLYRGVLYIEITLGTVDWCLLCGKCPFIRGSTSCKFRGFIECVYGAPYSLSNYLQILEARRNEVFIQTKKGNF